MMPFAIQVAQFQLVTLVQFKVVTYNPLGATPLLLRLWKKSPLG